MASFQSGPRADSCLSTRLFGLRIATSRSQGGAQKLRRAAPRRFSSLLIVGIQARIGETVVCPEPIDVNRSFRGKDYPSKPIYSALGDRGIEGAEMGQYWPLQTGRVSCHAVPRGEVLVP